MTVPNTDTTETPSDGGFLSNKVYDLLKRVVTLVLPAFGTLYYGLADAWGLPNPSKVAATCLVLATFLGVLLNVAGRKYVAEVVPADGEIVVTENPDGSKSADLVLTNYEDPADVVAQDRVTFTVRKA